MLAGHPPFFEADVPFLLERIRTADYSAPSHLSEDAQHLIALMLVPDPEKRSPLKEIAEVKWLNEGVKGRPTLAFTRIYVRGTKVFIIYTYILCVEYIDFFSKFTLTFLFVS